MVSVSVLFCFVSQWMKRSKHGLFGFPPKETLIWGRHCSIGQLCCSKTSKRSINWFLESSSFMKFFQPSVRVTNQKPRAFVFVRQNQSNRSVSFSLLFLFSGHTKITLTAQNIKIKANIEGGMDGQSWRGLKRGHIAMVLFENLLA